MNTRRWKPWVFAGIVGAWVLVLAGCGDSSKSPAPQAETVRAKVANVRMETVPDEWEASGTVQSATTAEIAARVMAPVLSVPVREGDVVKRGQLLVQLDAREWSARQASARAAVEEAAAAREQVARNVTAAEAEARVAAKTFERFQFLQKEKSVSPQEFDEVEAKYSAAQAALAAAKARQRQVQAASARAESEAGAAEAVASYTRITAPFDGVVARRDVEPGVMASPGMTLLVLEEASRYQLEVTLPAGAGVPRRGAAARVRLDAAPEKMFAATVAEVESGADAKSQTVRVRLDLPRDAALRSGVFGRAWFPRGERKALLVPQAAVAERGQLRHVFVPDGERVARLRLVTLGAQFGDRWEVLSGLQEGDQVVLLEPGRAVEGRRVEAQP